MLCALNSDLYLSPLLVTRRTPPQNLTLQEWSAPFLQPAILAIASDTVEDACARNGLTFAELLKPFAATLDGIRALQVRGVSRTVNLRGFGFRVLSPAELSMAQHASADKYLESTLNTAPLKRGKDQLDSDGVVDQADARGYFRSESPRCHVGCCVARGV